MVSGVGSWRRTLAAGWPAAAVAAVGGGTLGTVILAGSPGAAIAALACGTVLAGIAGAAMARRDAERRARLVNALRALGRGDTSRRLELSDLTELEEAASLVNHVAALVGGSAARVVEHTRQLMKLPDEIASAIIAIEKGGDDQEAAVEETASLFANINTSIQRINGDVENLARANEETASSIMEMGSAVDQVASSAGALQHTVESSTSAVHQMGGSIRRIAESSDNVQQVAEETASSIAEMDRTIQEVGEHVRGASQLTTNVSESADFGSQAVGATIDGIAEIRKLTLGARSALEGLAQRIGEIGEIATVIGGISDETNLLSLNAAIIAAQAGEHGKAFAVVADQVKTLARRTTQSTQEIERLIGGVQQESENAVRAMGEGIMAVEAGVDRSRRAGEALETIRAAAADASGRVDEIERAANQQAQNSKYVAEAARRTSEHVQQISQALGEQTRASDQLLENSQASLEMCRQMTRATEEQRETGRYIHSKIESVTEMIRSIQASTASQENTSRSVAETFEYLLACARNGGAKVPELTRAVAALREHAAAVSAEAERFERAERSDPAHT